MTTYINTTHASLDAAGKPMTLDALAKRLHGANPTKTQVKNVECELKALHQAGLLESTPGRGGVPYYSLTTTTAPAAPQPTAAAVAVFSALEGGTDPVPDLAQQLREAHAERLAMSQTIIAICCAIGRDPGQTTTSELPQALRDYIDAQIERETAELTGIIADIRAAIGDNTGRIRPEDLAKHIAHQHADMARDQRDFAAHLEAVYPITYDVLGNYADNISAAEAVRIMDQLIDAQHAHIHAQALQIETQAADLDNDARKIADQEQQIAELRARVAAQIQAGHESASSANRLLTEVHEVLANGWPGSLEAPQGRTTLQLAHAMAADFGRLFGDYLAVEMRATPTPDTYIVTRNDTPITSRHKNQQAAHRKARAAVLAGARNVEIIAGTRIARAVRGAEIKPV